MDKFLTLWNSSDKFNFFYTLDQPPEDWDGFTGFINEEMISKTMPPPSDDTLILLCGPPKMNVLVKNALEEIGYSKESIFNF